MCWFFVFGDFWYVQVTTKKFYLSNLLHELDNYHIYQYFGQLKLKVARFISPLYQFNIWDSKEMYVLFQQTGNCSVTIVVLNISLFGAAIYPNLLKDQPATSGNP